MDTVNKYFEFLQQKLKDAQTTQVENLQVAADMILASVNDGGNFYVFGSGHSHMVAEELYTRAGGLSFVKAILPPELMLHQMPRKSTNLERLSGYSKAILDLYPITEKDTFLIITNSGRNNAPIEMCLEAQKRGAKVIALTSLHHSKGVTSRHVGGKNLYEIADLVLDNQAELGDASFYVEGVDSPVGGISDFIGIALAQALVVTITEKMIKSGQTPPVLRSANVDEGDAYNQKIRE